MSIGDSRPEPPLAAPPEQMVVGFLDFLRATLVWKLEGLNEEQARRSMTPSGVSLLSIVKHSAAVERWWFHIVFADLGLPPLWSNDDPDADWRLGPDDTISSITAHYQAQWAISRDAIAGASWGDVAKRQTKQGDGITLGWILTHMVEEVGRHCGHADILREAIDGVVGE